MQLIKAIWLDRCLRVLLLTIRNYLLKNFNLNGNSQLEFLPQTQKLGPPSTA